MASKVRKKVQFTAMAPIICMSVTKMVTVIHDKQLPLAYSYMFFAGNIEVSLDQ